jgi:hypothetical protein
MAPDSIDQAGLIAPIDPQHFPSGPKETPNSLDADSSTMGFGVDHDNTCGPDQDVVNVRLPMAGNASIVQHEGVNTAQMLREPLGAAHLAASALLPDGGALRLLQQPRDQHAEPAQSFTCAPLVRVAPALVLPSRGDAGARFADEPRRWAARQACERSVGPIPERLFADPELAPTGRACSGATNRKTLVRT